MKEENLDREILFFRYCAGLADADEKLRVEEMIAVSGEVSDELNAVRGALAIQKNIRVIEACDIPAGYKGVRHRIMRADRRKRFISVLSHVAAILALPLLITTLTFAYLAMRGTQEEAIVYAEIVSAPGVVSRFELPDKSKVWLNSNSVLRYPSRFGASVREVELVGEGYFEVQSDKDHPFYVKTSSGVKVMAHGTHFNVNSQHETVEAILAEGKVAVFYTDQKLKELNPGEQLLFDSETGVFKIKEVSLYEKLAWTEGKIVFRNAPLDDVFEQLSRRYNVDIILHDEHQQSANYLSRVTFTDETIHQIFSYLEIAAPIEWKITSPVQNSDSTLTRQRIDVWLKKK